MKVPFLPALLLASAVTAALGGCASGMQQENEAAGAAATRAFEAYARALRKEDYAAAYALLSSALRKRATAEEFRAHCSAHRERYQRLAEAKVEKTQYDDFRVALRVTDGAGVTEWVLMVPEGSGWRVDDAGQNLAELCRRFPSSGRP